jgi:hypothetical protein
MQVYNHVIYLSETQRYDLFACVPVRAYGVLLKASINNKNFNVQDLQEVFCEYVIDCDDAEQQVEFIGDVMHLHLPYPDESDLPIPFQPDNLEKYDLYDLLNAVEGGRESLFYQVVCRNNDTSKKSFHKIEIKDITKFEEGIEFIEISMSPKS